ncbi:MAG TPA: NAD(P)H-dependent oxidoreductase [Xanthobacteraceae bacterium]|nr:NAD(P)H-dependent oxidoreductase [Xanthobacteraceae bacterium]
MSRRILVIDGHPDPDPARLCHALAGAYRDAAASAGHEVKTIEIASAGIDCLRDRAGWERGQPDLKVSEAQAAIAWADHLVIVYPLWLGAPPALLKGFFEQVLRPGFAFKPERMSLSPGLLKGKTARIVVTMGMPAFLYRWFFFAHTLRSLKRNILRYSAITPAGDTLVGPVDKPGVSAKALETMRALGSAAR